MPDSKYFRFGIWLVLIFVVIYLGSLISWVFQPIIILVQTLFAPILLGGVLYYLLRPLVNFLSRWIPRTLSILIIFLTAIALIVLMIFLIGPEIQNQFNQLVENWPTIVNGIREWIVSIQTSEWFARFQEGEIVSFEDIVTALETYMVDIMSSVGSNITNVIGVIANVLVVMAIIPFVLFFMLKDGKKAPENTLKLLPKKQQAEGRRILSDMDDALSSYIQGQIIVSFCVGVMMYIGYLIVGIDYPLVLALIAMFTNVIPFIGPWIGAFPGVIVALFDSLPTALFVAGIIVIVQQIESNLISPIVMGKKLAIHPLTIILLLLVASKFAGLLGLLLAVPTYAVGKVIVYHLYRLWRLKKPKMT
ncbi:AI-2E family transporter [Alkalihalobacillus pseudalcaliphilus]|uniref:AI-2E family transporter n=1 Tax=Alkalihalobacillus pseudalcaliphilus TaxID=79884 RepID=UPI00064DB407|nr:AI-2E family transporter [Alkalihalobacillus pseudalcaliphilus]KMK74750.1 membrane protein [Alkalihalobacillus pseudalcaliphilus]